MSKPLVVQLKEKMKERRVSFPQLAELTGIPAPRMYKWYQQDSTPKHEDAVIIEKWIKGEELDINLNEEPVEAYNKATSWEVIMKLAAANEKLSDANQRLARGNEELILMTKSSLASILKSGVLQPEISKAITAQAPLGDLFEDKMNMKKEDTAPRKGKVNK